MNRSVILATVICVLLPSYAAAKAKPAGTKSSPVGAKLAVDVPQGWLSFVTSTSDVRESVILARHFEPDSAVAQITVTRRTVSAEEVSRTIQNLASDTRMDGGMVLGEPRAFNDGQSLSYITGRGRSARSGALVFKAVSGQPREWIVIEAVWFVDVDRLLRPEFEAIVDSAQLK